MAIITPRSEVPQSVWQFWERIYRLTIENTQRGPRSLSSAIDLDYLATGTADAAVLARYGIVITRTERG